MRGVIPPPTASVNSLIVNKPAFIGSISPVLVLLYFKLYLPSKDNIVHHPPKLSRNFGSAQSLNPGDFH